MQRHWGLRRKCIDLAAGRSEGVLDRGLGMLMTRAVRRRIAHYDVLVRGYREPDVDLESGAVTMSVARGDHLYSTSRNALIVHFEALDFIQYLRAGCFRSFRTFKGDLRVDLHEYLSIVLRQRRTGAGCSTALQYHQLNQALLGYLNSGAALS